MALIICSKCKSEYDDSVSVCPNCGCPTDIPSDGIQNPPEPTMPENSAVNIDTPAVESKIISGPVNQPPIHNEVQTPISYGAATVVQPKKKLLIPLIASVAAVLVIGGIVTGIFVHKSNVKKAAYAQAEMYYSNGDYETAQVAFANLGTFKDAADRVFDCMEQIKNEELAASYNDGIRAQRNGEYEDAITIFTELGDYEDAATRATYCTALSYANKGDYISACEELKTIPDYEETQLLLMQCYYESRFFVALSDFRVYLKNPDTLSVKEVSVHYGTDSDSTYIMEEPCFLINTSAQNGYGGYASSYSILGHSKGETDYNYLGSFDSFDEDDYNLRDDDDFWELLIMYEYEGLADDPEIKDAIDLNRIASIISLDRYSTISIVENVTIDDFRDALEGCIETTVGPESEA